jgi:RHS repeat-associated protein
LPFLFFKAVSHQLVFPEALHNLLRCCTGNAQVKVQFATYTITAGTTPDLVLTFSTNFTGEVRSIQVIPGTAITSYNHLNLPTTIGQGLNSIKYIYDATGRKLSQEVFGVSDLIKKKSDYAGEYFYENDTLKFIQHEEGRIIPETGGSYTYQYNLKDHLGNVRLTFTTKQEVESSTATMETANASAESGQYLYYDEAIKISDPLYDHTYNNTTGSTYYATRLTGGNTNAVYGLAKSLSVMPGDTVKAEVFAKYLDYSDSTNWSQGLKNLVKSISQGTAPIGTRVDGGAAGSLGASTYPFTPINHTSESGTAPMAYLNYVVVNRDYTTVLDQGFMRVTTNAKESGQNVAHEALSASIAIQEPGYVYIYLSNENPTIVEVFFDDFKVEHIKSPVIQMDDYYPFGLTFNSYSRENNVEQKYTYNSKEEQDELGLGWLDFGRRMYQPDIGRFMVHDRFTEKFFMLSPYQFAANNPLSFIDINGDSIVNITRSGQNIAIENSPSEEGGKNFTNTITLESDVSMDDVSDYSAGIVNDAMIAIGDNLIVISSGTRTPVEQANVMYGNLEKGSVAGEKDTYGAGGDKVIDTYAQAKAETKEVTDACGTSCVPAYSPGQIKQKMLDKINEVGPGKVSNHTVNDRKSLNVFDIKPSTVLDPTKMHNSLSGDTRVRTVLSPVNKKNEKAIHVEIVQTK